MHCKDAPCIVAGRSRGLLPRVLRIQATKSERTTRKKKQSTGRLLVLRAGLLWCCCVAHAGTGAAGQQAVPPSFHLPKEVGSRTFPTAICLIKKLLTHSTLRRVVDAGAKSSVPAPASVVLYNCSPLGVPLYCLQLTMEALLCSQAVVTL